MIDFDRGFLLGRGDGCRGVVSLLGRRGFFLKVFFFKCALKDAVVDLLRPLARALIGVLKQNGGQQSNGERKDKAKNGLEFKTELPGCEADPKCGRGSGKAGDSGSAETASAIAQGAQFFVRFLDRWFVQSLVPKRKRKLLRFESYGRSGRRARRVCSARGGCGSRGVCLGNEVLLPEPLDEP